MTRRLRSYSRAPPSPSTADLRIKLTRIIASQEQLKISFDQLTSQIKLGLLEAEGVFVSLAIPLMKLVGLKTDEMTEEGRFSAIFMDSRLHSDGCSRNEFGSETMVRSSLDVNGANQNHKVHKLEEKSYITRATMADEELIQKQKLQLVQLVHLFKRIDTQVNSSQNDILQTLANSRSFIQNVFHKAVKYAHSNQDNTTLANTLKLLKATFDYVGVALRSVESGVEDVMQELSEKMGNPMVAYVKVLKAEMSTGTCPRLLAIVEEMEGAMRDGRLQLEEARKKVRITEDLNLEALRRLKESEEIVRKMKEHFGFFLEFKQGSAEHSKQHKLLGMEGDQAKDEKLLWEILKKKRKCQIPESPLGPKELLGIGTNNKHLKSIGIRQSIGCRSVTRSISRGLSQQTPGSNSWLPLGSSPSTTIQQVSTRKRAKP